MCILVPIAVAYQFDRAGSSFLVVRHSLRRLPHALYSRTEAGQVGVQEAEHYQSILDSEAFDNGRWVGRTLLIHSGTTGDNKQQALADLEAVEDPNSPVRIIINVAMLKESWDVKNVYLIASIRASDGSPPMRCCPPTPTARCSAPASRQSERSPSPHGSPAVVRQEVGESSRDPEREAARSFSSPQ